MQSTASTLDTGLKYAPTQTDPWTHQKVAYNNAMRFDGYYLAHDMGAGKSKTAIDITNGLDAKVVLIVCPKSVISVWPLQFKTHSYHEYIPIIPPKSYTVRRKAEFIQQKLRQAQALRQRAIIVLNYESMYLPPLGPTYNPRNNRMIRPGFLHHIGSDCMICDEAHRIKSPGGKQSRVAKWISKKARYRLALSGTPMPHSPLDIFAQSRYVNEDLFGTSFVRFRARFAVMGGFENKQVLTYQNLDELHRIFYRQAHRVEIDDVVELPTFTHEYRYVDLPPKAMKVYKKMDRDFIVALARGEVTASNGLVKMLRLAQMAGGVAKLDDGTEELFDSSKIDVAREILEDLPPEEPVVIFCRFTMEVKRMQAACEKIGRTTSQLAAGVDELKDWQDGFTNTLVVNIKSGAEGVDFTRARYTIYISKGLQLGVYLQSLRRTRRPGQTRKGKYYHILANDTIDIKENKAMEAKENVVNYVLRDVKDHL